MTNSRLKQIMAYFYMPLFFMLLGYGIVYLACLPILNTIFTVGSIITSNGTPSFDTEFNIIYDREIAEEIAITQDDEVTLEEIKMPYYGSYYGQISCDAIGFDAPLFFGDNATILRNGVGQYIGSSIPGFNMPLLLCGHNTTYCLPLQYIKVDDIITISTNYGTYEYKVTETAVHNMNDTSAYNLNQQKEQLILYTCYPFDIIGTKIDRLFVYADKISGPDVLGITN